MCVYDRGDTVWAASVDEGDEFESAVAMYDQLCKLHPEVEEYKLYKAQSLHKSGNYAEAVSSDFPQRSVCQASRPSRYTTMFTRT